MRPTQSTHPAARRSRLVVRGLLVAALVAGILPASAAAAPGGAAGATDGPPGAASGPFRLALHDAGDFVAQTNNIQCVGASMQMMLNMILPESDRTAATQLRLQELARVWSGPTPSSFDRRGASVHGWVVGLTVSGLAGRYRLAGELTLEDAVRTAARAIRETGRPVGLVVWRGRHAWVMSGFEATADPLVTDDFEVTAVHVMDPLYPAGSNTWGASPRPGAALSLEELGRQFVARGHGTPRWAMLGRSSLGGKYVLVLPYEPASRAEWLARIL